MVLTNLKETLQAQVMIPFHLLLKNYCLYISLAFGKTFSLVPGKSSQTLSEENRIALQRESQP
jgi:hypothetical protein